MAAIFWNPCKYKGNIKIITKTENYVIIKANEMTIISVYISPNINMKQTEKILDSITNEIICVKNQDGIIICGDFNAHSQSWGSTKETSRGALVNEWMASLDLIIVNSGRTPTCIRKQGKSIVDITIATEEVNNRILRWRVIDQESLSNHKYIITEIKVTNRKSRDRQIERQYKQNTYMRWKWNKANLDMFSALLIGLVNRIGHHQEKRNLP